MVAHFESYGRKINALGLRDDGLGIALHVVSPSLLEALSAVADVGLNSEFWA